MSTKLTKTATGRVCGAFDGGAGDTEALGGRRVAVEEAGAHTGRRRAAGGGGGGEVASLAANSASRYTIFSSYLLYALFFWKERYKTSLSRVIESTRSKNRAAEGEGDRRSKLQTSFRCVVSFCSR